MKKTFKIILTMLVMFFAYAMLSNVKAASASLGASETNVSVGDKVTITVDVDAAAWDIHVSGAVSGAYADTSSDGNNTKFSKSLTFTPSSEGSYTVKMTGTVSDGTTNATTDANGKITINASAKSNNKTTNNGEKKTEPTFKSVNETMYATGNINVRKSYTADSDKIGSLGLGEKVTRTGVGDNGWSKVSYNGSVGYIKSSLLSSEEPKKSDDKSLKSLSIEGIELSPAFDPETTDYSATVDESVEKIEIKAEVNNEKAKKEISGNEELKKGENVVKVTVTAEDGTTRIYTINVTKKSKKAVALSTLKINGYTLNPKFSPEVTEYKVTVLDPNVTKLDVSATTDVEKAKVEVTGNSGLKNGDNVILVNVTSEDGTQKTTYKIIVTKNAAGVTQNDKSNNWILYAGIGIIAILVIAIIAVIVVSKRRAQYEDDEEYEEDENDVKEDYSDLYGDLGKQQINDYDKDVNRDYGKELEKETYTNDSIYGDFSARANSQRAENTTDISDYSSSYSGEKDINYYNNKVSELFDTQENMLDKTAQDAFGYLPDNANESKENNEYSSYDDEYKLRKSKGKHSK